MPAACGEIWRKFRSPVVQLSGGEPLLRGDIAEIAGAVKGNSSIPYIILVSNGYLLNEEIYLKLRGKGVNQFSVSIDFPDERHDKFRRLRGLYRHLENTIPRLARLGHNDIALNCCITKENFRYIPDILNRAGEWGVSISFSAYSSLRTNDMSYSISSPEDLKLLEEKIRQLIEVREKDPRAIRTPSRVLSKTYEFFRRGSIPRCHAGERFLLVSPDGRFRPCAHHQHYYKTHKELLKEFSKHNRCGSCLVSVRAFCDVPFGALVREYLVGALRGKWKL